MNEDRKTAWKTLPDRRAFLGAAGAAAIGAAAPGAPRDSGGTGGARPGP